MAKCKHCGGRFHYCTSCGGDGYSEHDLCSEGCRELYVLSLSECMELDDALRIVREMAADTHVMTPRESAALRKVLGHLIAVKEEQ